MLDIQHLSNHSQLPWSDLSLRPSCASPEFLADSHMRSVSAEERSDVEDMIGLEVVERDEVMVPDQIQTNLTVPTDWLEEGCHGVAGDKEKKGGKKSYGTKELLETYDWSSTPLGPVSLFSLWYSALTMRSDLSSSSPTTEEGLASELDLYCFDRSGQAGFLSMYIFSSFSLTPFYFYS